MKENGESICGKQGGPFKHTKWMVSTHKNNFIYLHLFAWPEKQLKLPKFEKTKILSAQILNGVFLSLSEQEDEVWIQLPKKPSDLNNTVIRLQLDGKASAVNPLDVPANMLTTIH